MGSLNRDQIKLPKQRNLSRDEVGVGFLELINVFVTTN